MRLSSDRKSSRGLVWCLRDGQRVKEPFLHLLLLLLLSVVGVSSHSKQLMLMPSSEVEDGKNSNQGFEPAPPPPLISP